jgi:peptidoglycan/xylan/chitin deacetylase (PgdA/CDA1 family)
MVSVLRNIKQSLWKIVGFLLFYSGALRRIHYLVDRYQGKRGSSGRAVFPYIKRRRSRSVQILAYHRINDEHDPFFPATPTEVFARQMEYLDSNFSVCPLADLVERMRKRDIPENAVAITFDDGYRDNYLNAFPILRQLSLPATIFLATGAIGSAKVLWHDRVFSAFRETRARFLENPRNNLGRYPLGTLGEKLFAQTEVLKVLQSLDDRGRSLWIDRLIEKLGVADGKEVPDLMLTWDDIKVMHQSKISFGSHTVTHPILSKIPSDRVREEIFESKKILDERLSTTVRTFAYPVGRKEDFNEMTKDYLREAGYICALTSIFGSNSDGDDLFELRRGKPWEEYLPVFATKLDWYRLCY